MVCSNVISKLNGYKIYPAINKDKPQMASSNPAHISNAQLAACKARYLRLSMNFHVSPYYFERVSNAGSDKTRCLSFICNLIKFEQASGSNQLSSSEVYRMYNNCNDKFDHSYLIYSIVVFDNTYDGRKYECLLTTTAHWMNNKMHSKYSYMPDGLS